MWWVPACCLALTLLGCAPTPSADTRGRNQPAGTAPMPAAFSPLDTGGASSQSGGGGGY